ncbi:MAG: ribose-phosphate pyrophosphokinase [Pseudomonadales bacterium]
MAGNIVMTNDIKIIAGSAHPELAQEICAHLGLEATPTRLHQFSNENIMFQVLENVREADVFIIQPSCPPVSQGIIEALMMIDALKHASARRVTAVMPYFPYARSDKKDQPRISITARLMADLLGTAGADRVLTMNLHSPQVQGFFRMPADHLNATPLVCEHLQNRNLDNFVIVAGDVGEAKDAGEYASRLHLPMAIIDKRRYDDNEDPKAVGLIGEVADKHALIVDDEIASGGTMVEAARFLKEHGVLSIDAAVVHPVLSGRAIERLQQSDIQSMVVTNTVPVPPEKRIDKIEVISVAGILGDAIHAIHNGDSVSKLFS